MTITNPSSYTKDTDAWVHGTFVVSLGNNGSGGTVDYATYVKVVNNNCQDELYGNGITPTLETNMATVIAGAGTTNGPLPIYFSHSKCRDTSLGGNDAINSYYQYNETDDPPHPFTAAETSASRGMGRVYSETIDDHQQILYITFGLPVFNNLSSFYTAALDKDIADLVNQGVTTTLMSKLTAMAGATVTTLVKLPSLPFLYIQKALNHTLDTPITKYYDFSNKMALYYKYVQTIMTHLSVNMGFLNDGNFVSGGSSVTTSNLEDIVVDGTDAQKAAAAAVTSGSDQGIPSIFRTFHMDIYQILQRRASFLQTTNGSSSSNQRTTDQNFADATQEATTASNASATSGTYDISMLSPIQSLLNGFVSSIYNAQLYIGFRVEKTTDSSEAISNQIGPSEIASFINSKSQAARDNKFKAMYGRTGIGPLDAIGNFLGGLANSAEQAIGNSNGIEGLTALATGSGMIDIPEVWKDSSVSKHYSFDMRLRSPYGDPISILQNNYVPLALILAGALPRATGASSYGTPFICRAYCKGMFAVPLGMIENVTIKRGGDTHGWTYQRLPTSIDIQFTIKDLSPCMYMAMADLTGTLGFSDNWNAAFGNNSSFQEYMLTLSGMGLAERSLMILNIKRKVQILMQSVFDTKLNPFYWGLEAGSTMPARLISAIIPTTKIPTN